jgi:hypothetical protein
MLALFVDLPDQIRQRHLVTVSNPLQALPEGILNTHASRATAKGDWAANYRGFHAAPNANPTNRIGQL